MDELTRNPLPSPVPSARRKSGGVTKRTGGVPRVNLDGLTEDELRERVDVWRADRSALTIEGRVEQPRTSATGAFNKESQPNVVWSVAKTCVAVMTLVFVLPILFILLSWVVTYFGWLLFWIFS
jgi:hypothetical protein